MTKPKILIFAHDASLYGASQSLLILLASFQKNNTFEMLVLLPHKGPMEERLFEMDINYQIINFPRCFYKNENQNFIHKIKLKNTYNKNVKNILPQLIEITNSFKPQLVYSNSSIVSIGQILAAKFDLPHIWHIREFGDLDYNFEYLPSKRLVIKQMLESSHIIFVSNALKKHWLGNEKKASSNVVYNAVPELEDDYKKSTSFAQDYYNVGLLGAVLPGKGQEIAIKAFRTLKKKYPQVRLFIYGNVVDKLYHDKLLALISSNTLQDTVFFMPFNHLKNEIYKELDALISCASNEGFGRTIIEAMQRGIPVIANASGGPLEIIEDSKTGFLYNGSEDDLVKKISFIISNREETERVAGNGQILVRTKFNEKIYVEKISHIFNKILNNDQKY